MSSVQGSIASGVSLQSALPSSSETQAIPQAANSFSTHGRIVGREVSSLTNDVDLPKGRLHRHAL
jgi:hypothetical protein